MSSRLYNTVLVGMPGETIAGDPTLAYCDIISVRREQRVNYLCNVAPDLPQPVPGDAEVLYERGSGSFTFNADTPFFGIRGSRPNTALLERIYIIYKRSI